MRPALLAALAAFLTGALTAPPASAAEPWRCGVFGIKRQPSTISYLIGFTAASPIKSVAKAEAMTACQSSAAVRPGSCGNEYCNREHPR
jgi:hypothetical protein